MLRSAVEFFPPSSLPPDAGFELFPQRRTQAPFFSLFSPAILVMCWPFWISWIFGDLLPLTFCLRWDTLLSSQQSQGRGSYIRHTPLLTRSHDSLPLSTGLNVRGGSLDGPFRMDRRVTPFLHFSTAKAANHYHALVLISSLRNPWNGFFLFILVFAIHFFLLRNICDLFFRFERPSFF